MLGFAFNVIFLVADVFAVDRNEVNAILNLHFHVEDLMFDHLLVVIFVFVTYKQRKSLSLAFETIVLVYSRLLVN